jgi:hypothetical protein
MIDPKLIESVAKSDFKGNFLKYLEQVKSEVADIRNGNHTNETRKAVIEIIDELIVNKIKVMSGEVRADWDDYR